MKKALIVLLILSLFIYFYVYKKEIDNIGEKEKRELSFWAVYWDLEEVPKEIQNMESSMKGISYFAAYFNKYNQIFIPKVMENLHLFLKGKDVLHFLSIVNDKMDEDGASVLKDKELLYYLLEDERNREEHIANLVSLCLEYGYDGIEIDYEGFRKDEHLWLCFLEFCNSLWETLNLYNLNMRVVLEPSAPIERYKLPKGPDYVIMCYNLYGAHSEPGPKANKEFLKSIAKKTKRVLEEVDYALATGGFDWDSKGNVTALTEKRAIELLKTYDIIPKRDKESHSLFFKYTDQENIKHEIWFADKDTIKYWMDILAKEGGKSFSLWRLGGNRW